MKKIIFLITSMLIPSIFATKVPSKQMTFEVNKNTKKYSKLKNLMLCYGTEPIVLKFAKIVFDDLDFTDQFDVELKKTDKDLEKISLQKLFENGVSLITFIKSKLENKKVKLNVIVKDTSSSLTVFNKDVVLEDKKLVWLGHDISSNILESLTGDKGICLSSLAYCKSVSPRHKIICLSDYSCRKTKIIVSSRTINLAPRWHSKAPVLFYSQLTKSNNRLMSVNLDTMRNKVVCSYSGLNMQPSFSDDGKRAVICLSGGKGNSELYLYNKKLCMAAGKRVFKRITKNGGHNVCPSLLSNGNIVFCSDYRTGSPQIYCFDADTRAIKMLTDGKGYAAAPSYCKKTNMVTYVRTVNGVFQLFSILLDNLDNVKEKQITFCPGNKHEPCWSQDGRYIAFSFDRPYNKNGKNIPQIAALNYKSGKIRVLTKGPKHKSFPRWTNKKLF